MNYNKKINKKLFMGKFFKHFIDAREKYGFTDYDKNLCNYLSKNFSKGSKLLEVAVGNGYPFADFFQKEGYLVYGTDISPYIIRECVKLNPNIECKVCDAENLDYSDNFFDCVYCFHSTFYFPDLNKAIDEMIRVTRHGGGVIFDIQNKNNENIKKAFQGQLRENSLINVVVRHIKNFMKIVLQRGSPIQVTGIYEVPADPESLYEYFKSKYKEKISFIIMVKKEGSHSIEVKSEFGGFKDFHRLIFVIRKK